MADDAIGSRRYVRLMSDDLDEVLRRRALTEDAARPEAVARRHAATTFFALPVGVRRVIGANGPDGADLALIDSIDVDWATRNFGRVVIGSGDHIFSPLARQLTARGLQVLMVTGGGYCSAELYRACTAHVTLSPQRLAASVLQCAS